MANCPECGEPLVKGSRSGSRYYCENERCARRSEIEKNGELPRRDISSIVD